MASDRAFIKGLVSLDEGWIGRVREVASDREITAGHVGASSGFLPHTSLEIQEVKAPGRK